MFEHPIAQNLIAAVLCSIIGYLLAVVVESYRRRSFWGFLPYDLSTVCVVIGSTGNAITELGYSRLTTTATDAIAAGYVASSLRAAFGTSLQITIKSCHSFSVGMWNSILVLVGGRVRNAVTRELLSRLEKSWEIPLDVLDHDPADVRRIVDRRTGCEYRAEREGDHITRDWAILYRVPNPMAGDNLPVFILYGLHAFGTEGAGRLFWQSALRRLAKELSDRDSRWCQVLISVVVKDQEVFPEIVLIHQLRRRSTS